MHNEQNDTKTPVPANGGHDSGLAGRLILALVVCLIIVGAAIAYDKFG
ncbi:hypothetical protein [Archangium lansingense]|uniref:Uncharacterized protein n=1 Tax=Archangium lansingense TaxID=2995310 RepID=A0ABT3ZZY9_9BACT|nr:hypothetical protein [Archangium lansinium]MCY1074972.1 hypothetical protein [Archangium lansinium]